MLSWKFSLHRIRLNSSCEQKRSHVNYCKIRSLCGGRCNSQVISTCGGCGSRLGDDMSDVWSVCVGGGSKKYKNCGCTFRRSRKAKRFTTVWNTWGGHTILYFGTHFSVLPLFFWRDWNRRQWCCSFEMRVCHPLEGVFYVNEKCYDEWLMNMLHCTKQIVHDISRKACSYFWVYMSYQII